MLIIDNLKENVEINREKLIRIALLHDMGNMAKMSDEQIEDPEFATIRNKYISMYGKDDHKINLVIGKQEGLTSEELDILDRKQLKRNQEIRYSDNYILKICAYWDQRVSPNGVTSLEDRLNELQIRHKNNPKGSMHNPIEAERLKKYALEIEKQIMNCTTIKKEDINEKSINSYIDKLKKYNLVNKEED